MSRLREKRRRGRPKGLGRGWRSCVSHVRASRPAAVAARVGHRSGRMRRGVAARRRVASSQ